MQFFNLTSPLHQPDRFSEFSKLALKKTLTFPPASLWIEAENLVYPSAETPADSTDVIVTLQDGSQWVATFYPFISLCEQSAALFLDSQDLTEQFFWTNQVAIIKEIKREIIEEVIDYLFTAGTFDQVFKKFTLDEESP